MSNRPFPIDPTLTAIAIAYRNPAHTLIGRRVLPALEVLSENFKWTEYPLAEGFTVPETKVGRKGRPNQVEFSGTEKSASVSDYGLDDAIPTTDIKAAAQARAEKRSTYDPRSTAVEGLTNLIDLDGEVRVASIVQDANNYASDKKQALSGTSQFSDFANSDPYGVLDEAMGKTLIYRPNSIVMGRAVWDKFKRHPRLIKAIKGGLAEDGAITRQQFSDLMEISLDRLLIGEGYVNTARKGQNPTLARVWGKNIALLHIDPTKSAADDNKITFGFTATLGSRISGSIPDPDIGVLGGERVRVGERVKEVICAKDVGYLIQNAVA